MRMAFVWWKKLSFSSHPAVLASQVAWITGENQNSQSLYTYLASVVREFGIAQIGPTIAWHCQAFFVNQQQCLLSY